MNTHQLSGHSSWLALLLVMLIVAAHARAQSAPLFPCPNDFAEATNGAGGERLSRFGCVEAPGLGATAIRVVFRTLYNTTSGDPDGANVCVSRALLRNPLPSLSQFEGQTRWLGGPYEIRDENEVLNYIAAPLVCTAEEAEVRDWSPAGLEATFGSDAIASRIFFYGAAVVPCSVYEVSQCADPLDETTCSAPVLILTGLMGNIWPPFVTAGQPAFTDVNAQVNKFKGIRFQPGDPPLGGPNEWHALQYGNVVADYGNTPTAIHKVSFLDIGDVVNGFKGYPYTEIGPCGFCSQSGMSCRHTSDYFYCASGETCQAIDNCGNACVLPY